jgi:cytochrome c oxidase subunit 2
MARIALPRKALYALPATVLLVALVGASVALAQQPQPNPLPRGSNPALDNHSVTITANGLAASLHGDPQQGRVIFAQNCAVCHAPRGIGGVLNPGSDDGTVPSLNPIDPGFSNPSNPADSAFFARGIDLMVQHGSRPSGPNPAISMTAWGDLRLLTQPQIADVEAYVMELNGLYWPDRWAPPADIQMQASQAGASITYQILLENQGAAALPAVTLRDTLPGGLSYVTSYSVGLGNSPGKWNGSAVEWDTSIPRGGTQGPFVIVAQLQGKTAPADVAQIQFQWTDALGVLHAATAVSSPAVPAALVAVSAPASSAAAVSPEQAATAVPPASALVSATVAPTMTAATTSTVTLTATQALTPTEPLTATVTPATEVVTPTSSAALTATAVPAVAGDAAAGAQLFTTKTCVACHTVNGTGGKIGPDLSHIASQPYDSMGNDPATLARWLQNPPAMKPGTQMPNLGLTNAEIANLVAYLSSLR